MKLASDSYRGQVWVRRSRLILFENIGFCLKDVIVLTYVSRTVSVHWVQLRTQTGVGVDEQLLSHHGLVSYTSVITKTTQ